ncbi:MAG: PilZ domain-containing protein [Halobacteriovoraceae bacterium]|nr:PilZ domain-containing protein [Halobacteriovoraceae bacterium]
MISKPLYLTLFPFLAFGIALSFPIQIYYLYKIPLTDIERIFSMLTPLNILNMIVLFLAGAMTLKLNKAIYKIVPVLLIITLINNAIVGLYGSDFSLIQVGLSFVLLSLSLKPFYQSEIQAIILNPKLRWWKTPKRYDLKQPIMIKSNNIEINSESINMSTTGLFAKIEEPDLLDSIKHDDIFTIQLLKNNQEIELQVKVVRINIANKYQPNGLGLEIISDKSHKQKYLPWLKKEVDAINHV